MTGPPTVGKRRGRVLNFLSGEPAAELNVGNETHAEAAAVSSAFVFGDSVARDGRWVVVKLAFTYPRSINRGEYIVRLKLLMAGVVAGALATAGAANAATELVVNGGFTGDTRTGFTTVSAVSPTQIAGWTVLTNYVDWSNAGWQSSDGDGYSIDLIGGFGIGSIGQTIATTVGQTYNLTFDVSGNPDNYRDAGRIVTVSAGGAEIGASQYALGPANTRGNMLWSSRSLSFVATGALTQIVFTGTSGNPNNCCWGAALDNVSVTAVPEPATWAMMIIGFGAAGSMVRTSRRRNAFSAA